MTKIKRDWEHNAPPLSRRLREIEEQEWEQEFKDYLARREEQMEEFESVEDRRLLWRP